jgi:GNAT superfamily N-acetyltransferase
VSDLEAASAATASGIDIVHSVGSLPAAWLQQVEAIFFEASGRSFAPGAEREAFRQRWLGRYLEHEADRLLLALAGANVAGYLVGSLEDPSEQERFSDLDYYRADFAAFCQDYPAHLHINLAPAFRSRGIGQQLIEAFCAGAAGAGRTGVHVVTGKGMRNVRFYEKCGFRTIGAARWNGRDVVFLGKQLRPVSGDVEGG